MFVHYICATSLLALVFFTSCGKQHTDSQTSADAASSVSVPKQCSYYYYLTKITSSNASDTEQNTIFSLMENHKFFKPNEQAVYSSGTACTAKCDNLSLNSIYESLLAKNIRLNKQLDQHAAAVYLTKIFPAMDREMGHTTFRKSLDKWSKAKEVFPSLQRAKLFNERIELLSSKSRAFKYALGLEQNTLGEANPAPDSGLAFDYLIFNAKGKDDIGLHSDRATYKEERDYFFNALVRRMRGYRGNQVPKQLTSYYGVVSFDIPELAAPEGSIPWRNWGRDSCIVDRENSLYGKNSVQMYLPIACGISGTTNLALWSLFAYGVDLSEAEMQLFLLSAWSTLSVDTGHSLQEILTAAKLVAIYLRDIIEYPDSKYDYFRRVIPMRTLKSLEKITQDIRPLGNFDSHNLDRAKWESISQKLYVASWFDGGRAYPAMDSHEDLEALKDPNEQLLRDELEYYFNQYDRMKFQAPSQVQFGGYHDGFFANTLDLYPEFASARRTSQAEVMQYFRRSCHNAAQ